MHDRDTQRLRPARSAVDAGFERAYENCVKQIEFEYWSDPLCIWAYVAQPKLEAVLEKHGDLLAPRYRVVPVFGSVPQRFTTGSWADKGPKGRAEATKRVASEHGHDDVNGECWLEDCPASSWAPGLALSAVFRMVDEGAVSLQQAAQYQWRMRQRFFVNNENVARREVQMSLAEETDIPRAALECRLDDGSAMSALWEDHARRETLGLRGSPTFVFDGGRAMLYGNFSEAVLNATVEELVKGLVAGGSQC